MTHQFRMHVFVCTNERSQESPRGCCAAKNSLEILTRLKRAAKAEGLKDVRVNKAGCLDNCESGPSCVVYPEGTWYTLPEDDEGMGRILQHLAGGDVASEYLMGD
jgi:(2Fe-2S) ferredoxin